MTPNSKLVYLNTFAFYGNNGPDLPFRYFSLDILLTFAHVAKQQENKDLYYRLMTYLLVSAEWYELFVTYSYENNIIMTTVNTELFKKVVDDIIPPEAFKNYTDFVNIVCKLLNKLI